MAFNGGKGEFGFPIIADPDRKLSVDLGMLDPDEKDKAGMPLTCRAVCTVPWVKVFRISPEFRISRLTSHRICHGKVSLKILIQADIVLLAVLLL